MSKSQKHDISRQIERIKKYLKRLEERRGQDEKLNRRAYCEAREMSAWLSVYEFGSPQVRKLAETGLRRW